MLFDLQGKRRRVVQATYLTLALLMGGGLVLFGIGGDVAGGLFDAFSERGGATGGDVVEEQRERVEDAEKDLAKNPQDVEALETVVNGHVSLANAERDEQTLAYSLRGRSELFEAAGAWERYLATKPQTPDGEIADRVVDVYALLGEYKDAAATAEIVTKSLPSVEAWLTLAQFATWAKDKEKAEEAGDKAIELASEDERQDVRRQVKQVLKSKPPPQAPAEAPPSGGGSSPFQQPGQEGAPGGGAAPPGGGGAPPGGAPGGTPAPTPPPE